MAAHATDPAFNESSADIVLCSSDNILLKLHKVVLSLASEFFKDMFGLPQPSTSPAQSDAAPEDSEIDGLPAMHVTEPSAVLNKLLRLCYPLDHPSLDSIEEVRAVLAAALKYDLRKAIQIAVARLMKLAPSDALRVYAIACKLSLEDQAHHAAKIVRDQKVQHTYVAELEEISFGAYHRLLHYCASPHFNPEGDFFCLAAGSAHQTIHVPDTPSSVMPDKSPFASPNSKRKWADLAVLHDANDPYATVRMPDSSPIIVEESLRVMMIILALCSPSKAPLVDDLLDLHAALVAATKYQMHRAVQYLEMILKNLQVDFASKEPVLLYAVGCHLDMRELALLAARSTLRSDITKILLPKVDMIDVSAGSLYRLLDYHRRCEAAVKAIVTPDQRQWINQAWSIQLNICRRGYGSTVACWYSDYMRTIGTWPTSEVALQPNALENVVAPSSYTSQCSYCHSPKGVLLLWKFSRYLAGTIRWKEDEVKLDWPATEHLKPQTFASVSSE
ncbi:hypothetical protein C8Q80DRAFT_1275451 [Daedaleopsis nitida]|nr:hypothetical protein C8Q80DRAFT_1275451 [Daedaleopsis nitida]